MSQQRPVSKEPEAEVKVDLDDWASDEEFDEDVSFNDSTIYKKDSINPAKRRRLEAMREERDLLRDLKDVFDDYDYDFDD